ncbi:MAG: acyl-CoA thioesterase [Opitutales bacterium]
MSLLPLTHERVVEFAETDAAGLLHFTNYLRYVEAAERTLFEQLGFPLLRDDASGKAGFPRVDVSCKFRAPLRFGDRVRIRLDVAELGPRSIHYRFKIEKVGNGITQTAARGTLTTLYVQLDPATGDLVSEPLPAALQEALTPHLASLPGPAPQEGD